MCKYVWHVYKFQFEIRRFGPVTKHDLCVITISYINHDLGVIQTRALVGTVIKLGAP
jgi:hypothetical protein